MNHTIDLTNLFHSFVAVPSSGLAALVDECNREIYIFHSIDLIKTVAIHASKLRDGIHEIPSFNKNRNSVKLLILEIETHPVIQRAKYLMFLDKYKKLGYKDLRDGYIPVKFKVKYEIEKDYRNVLNETGLLVYVKLVSKRFDKYIVGVFQNMNEAREWGDKTYGNTEFPYPINAENELTKDYLSRL